MNTIKFQYIPTGFKVTPHTRLTKRLVAFIVRYQTAFQTIARTGQPFGGGAF
ncbi:MAG: hypothetical protein U0X91_02780 [Spirosomataceae bacterium]